MSNQVAQRQAKPAIKQIMNECDDFFQQMSKEYENMDQQFEM